MWVHYSGGASRRFQFAPLTLEFGNLHGAYLVEATRPNEFHYPTQFFFVKPRSVRFADVDDHRRTFGEVHTVHQLLANGAGNVTNLFPLRILLWLNRHRRAQHG